MKIGIHLPHVGPLASREGILAFARLAEEYGFDSLWVSDHVAIPRHIESRYPYRPDGAFPLRPDTAVLEPLATLLFAAAVTQRVGLGISVLVLPMRNPIVTAKMLATLDVLSNGRLILGVGAGWMAQEFRLLGVPFEHRGARTDEYIRLFKALWTEDRPSFRGKFWQIEDVGFAPKPRQRPHPPIWVGGHSRPALLRAGWLGDAWHAAFIGAGEARELHREVQRYALEAGRDPAAVGLTVRIHLPPDELPHAAERLCTYRDAGAAHLVVEITTADLEQAEAAMRTFARQVRPQVVS